MPNYNYIQMKFSPVNIDERRALTFRSGDTVRVVQKIKENDKTRLQSFEGLVIARKHGGEPGATFTVRKIASGVGVEKTFPLYSPTIDKIEMMRHSKTRASKLYFIRHKSAKDIRRKVRDLGEFVPVVSPVAREAVSVETPAEEEPKEEAKEVEKRAKKKISTSKKAE